MSPLGSIFLPSATYSLRFRSYISDPEDIEQFQFSGFILPIKTRPKHDSCAKQVAIPNHASLLITDVQQKLYSLARDVVSTQSIFEADLR